MRKLMVNIVCGVIPSRPLRKKLRAYLLNYAQEAMFLKFADSTVPPPPSTIPEKRYSSFTLDGRIPVRYRYYDSRIAGGKRIISRIDYANAFKAFEKG